jgi:hypothetical protein
MYPHLAEVVAETRFHECAGAAIKRLTRGAEHLVHDVRRIAAACDKHPGRLGLQPLHVFLLTGSAFAAELGPRGSDGGLRGRRSHHVVSDAVSLILERIVHPSDHNFGLFDQG